MNYKRNWHSIYFRVAVHNCCPYRRSDMRNIKYTDNCREIFSLKLAKFLESEGFAIISTRPDLKNTGRKIFLFANTPQLRQKIDVYMGAR